MEDPGNSDESKTYDKSAKRVVRNCPGKLLPPGPVICKLGKACCNIPSESSHTQYFKRDRNQQDVFNRITSDEYVGIQSEPPSSNISCLSLQTREQILEKRLLRTLDTHPDDVKWIEGCPPIHGLDLINTIEFLLSNTGVGIKQIERLKSHLGDFVEISKYGYNINNLNAICNVIQYLMSSPYNMILHEFLLPLFRNMAQPIHLNTTYDIVTKFEDLQNYYGFMGCLLVLLSEDDLFEVVSRALRWQLSAANRLRPADAVRRRQALAAAAPALYQTVTRMIAIARPHCFDTFIELALILVCENEINTFVFMESGILENILYRFNPYFPERDLPFDDINPADCRNPNLKLGDSSKHILKVMCLCLLMLKTVREHLLKDPNYRKILPCPDGYAQRCFVWAFRYECRAPGHSHIRNTFALIVLLMLHVYRSKLEDISSLLAPDIMALSVQTEIRPHAEWMHSVAANPNHVDVVFKKSLIYLAVELLHCFPSNVFMVETQHWYAGLVYLVDPNLFKLHRYRSVSTLYVDIRLTALQALVFTVPLVSPKLVRDCNIIRRMLWYIEWYGDHPFDIFVLYWCIRLLHVSLHHRGSSSRTIALNKLLSTHGIIILMNTSKKLMSERVHEKQPPVEWCEETISMCVRLITSAVENRQYVSCTVYTGITWPSFINTLVMKMLDDILYYIEKHYVINYKWLVALLNLIWEGIVWYEENRKTFIANNGIYKLLDLISMTRSSAQCLALAVLCDVARAGDGGAVCHMVTWRATLSASTVYNSIVKRGANIATLLASIFRDDCIEKNIKLDEDGIIQDLEHFLICSEVKEELAKTEAAYGTLRFEMSSVCFAAADMAGSRLSKVYALLSMLSEDLDFKVELADETYNLYKKVPIKPEDETVLLLSSHYLTMKLNETWLEIKAQFPELLPDDNIVLEEFLETGRGWIKEVQNQQKKNIKENRDKKNLQEESSLYTLLGKVRLTMSLDALREVRCAARCARYDPRLSYTQLKDAVTSLHRRFVKIVQPNIAQTRKSLSSSLHNQL